MLHFRVKVEGIDKLKRKLEEIAPEHSPGWMAESLVDCGQLVVNNAKFKQIIRGGRVRGPKGPRGGKGKMTSRKPHPSKLTSRSSRLRDSITVDRHPLPFAVEVTAGVVYADVHEFGRTVTQTVRRHRRQVAFGRKTKYPFFVPQHSRTIPFRKRPFMGPALEVTAKKFSGVFAKNLKKVINA